MPKPNPLSQGLKQQVRQAESFAPPAVTTTSTEVRVGKPVPPSRAGRVLIGGHFSPEVQTELKVLAAQERTTVQALIAEGINCVFARRHKPQIASLTPKQIEND